MKIKNLFARTARANALGALRLAIVLGAIWVAPRAQAALIGFYPFDGNDPQQDASTQNRPLESALGDPANNPGHTTTGGFEGGAATFNGAQRWIAPIDINPDSLPTLTMGAWVQTHNLTPGLRKVLGSDDGGWDRTIGLDDRNGPFRYASFTGSGISTGNPGPETTNHWTFFAATYDQNSGQLNVYVDLDSVSQEPLTAATTESTTFLSGGTTVSIGSVGPGSAGEGWQGLIDNVFFYDEVLSAERLTEIRNGGRKAILGQPADDPNLVVTSAPNLRNLSKLPNVKNLSFALRNSGATRTLNITRVTIGGPDANHFAVQTAPTSLAAGASANLDIQFDSRGQVGPFSAWVTVETDDPTTPSVQLDLSAQVVASANLLGLYSFDDAAAPLKDDSGAGKTLTDGHDSGAANPTYQAAGGISGGAFTFDGNDRLIAPININPSAVPRLAMGAWVKTSSLEPGLRKIMGHDDGAWDRAIGLDTRVTAEGGPMVDGTLRYAAFTGTNNRGPTQGDPAPTPTSVDAWSFVAADYDQANNLVTLYVDLDASSTADPLQAITADAPMGPGATTLAIGGLTPNGSGEAWQGSIDNAFILGGALDAAGMQAIRNGGKNALLQFRPDPVLVVSGDSPFGELASRTPTTVQVSVRNGGASQPLQIAAARITGRDAEAYSLGTVPETIAPGASVSIPVTLTPGNREGLLQATLELISNNSGGRRVTVDLSAGVPFRTLASALLGFYTFDDPANPLKDDSGNGRDLQPTDSPPNHLTEGGFEGGVYTFDGFQHLVAPINIGPSAQPLLTMGAWVRTDSLDPGLRKVIGTDDGGWDRSIGLDDRDPPILRYTSFAGNGAPIAGTPEPTSIEEWTFLAATYDQPSAIATVWVDLNAATTNDALVSVSRPNSVFGPGFATTAIGNLRPDNLAEAWVGSIDNVFFFNTVLSADDLKKLRDQGKAALLSGATDGPEITSVDRTATSLVLTWESQAGVNYTIEYRETLSGGAWASIGTQAGQAGTTSFTDSDAARLSRRTGFYRVSR